MLAWIIFTVLVIVATVFLMNFLHGKIVGEEPSYPEDGSFESYDDPIYIEYSNALARYHEKDNAFSNFSINGARIIAILLIFGSPFMVEFPTLMEKPSVATFDEEGDLVYHKWGLFTPPWKWGEQEVVNINSDTKNCHGVDYYNYNSSTIVEANGVYYSVEFWADICLDDPKKFFSITERRRLNGFHKHLRSVENSVRQALYNFHANRGHELGAVLKRCVGMGDDECAGLSSYIKDNISTEHLQREGLRLDMSSRMHVISSKK